MCGGGGGGGGGCKPNRTALVLSKFTFKSDISAYNIIF